MMKGEDVMSCWNGDNADLEKRFVPVAEAMRQLGCSVRTVYRLMEPACQAGCLDWLRTAGGRRRVDPLSA